MAEPPVGCLFAHAMEERGGGASFLEAELWAQRKHKSQRWWGGEAEGMCLLIPPCGVECLLTYLFPVASAQWLLPTTCGFSTCHRVLCARCPVLDKRGLLRWSSSLFMARPWPPQLGKLPSGL